MKVFQPKITILILVTTVEIKVFFNLSGSIQATMLFLIDSHFMTNNLTTPNLIPEKMKRVEKISSSTLKALRRLGVDLPPLNDSKLKTKISRDRVPL